MNALGRLDRSKIRRINIGVIIEYAVPTLHVAPIGIASGPDGALWIIEQASNKIVRLQ
jgi:virginiamycin B lyase